MIVSLPTLTSESELEENGTDSEPIAPTPTLAEVLLLRSAKRSSVPLTKTSVLRPLLPSAAQTTRMSSSMCISRLGWKLLRPLTNSALEAPTT